MHQQYCVAFAALCHYNIYVLLMLTGLTKHQVFIAYVYWMTKFSIEHLFMVVVSMHLNGILVNT